LLYKSLKNQLEIKKFQENKFNSINSVLRSYIISIKRNVEYTTAWNQILKHFIILIQNNTMYRLYYDYVLVFLNLKCNHLCYENALNVNQIRLLLC